MTPTQMARRSDALYADGTCGMTRRVLCDMVAQRESDLEDARAENTKLRELAHILCHCMQVHTECDDCVRWDHLQNECSLDVVMRELGVEVDG